MRQPTWTTVTVSGDSVTALDTYGADNLYGDSTVPLTGAALAEIEGILTGQDVVVRARKTIHPRVAVPDLLVAGEDLIVEVTLPANHAIRVTVRDEEHGEVGVRPRLRQGRARPCSPA